MANWGHIAKFNRLVASHGGRDKINKIFQYAARIAVWWFQSNPKALKRANAFKTLFGDTRRVGYLFGSIQVLPDLWEDLTTKNGDTKWLIKTIADSCDFVYYLCDNLPLFADYGLIPMRRATSEYLYDELGTQIWVMSSACWTALGVWDVQEMQASVRADPKNESLKQELLETQAATAANALNLLIGIYFLAPNKPITNEMAGVFGVVAALLSIWTKWK